MKSLRSELMLSFILIILISLMPVGSFTYGLTKKIIEKRVSESTVETLKQIDKNLNIILANVQDLSLFVISNHDVRTYLKTKKNNSEKIDEVLSKLYENFTSLIYYKPFISAVNIYGVNGLNFETAGPSDVKDKTHYNYERKIPQNGNYIITPTYERYYKTIGTQYIISFYRQINDINALTSKLGILRIDINENVINELYKDIKLGDTGYIFIVDKNGYIVSRSIKKHLSMYIKDIPHFAPIFNNLEGYYRRNIDGKNMLITHYTSLDQNLIIVGVVPYDELIKEATYIRGSIIFIIIVSIIVAFFLAYIISYNISMPVKKLTALMQEVECGNLDVVINIKRKDEIGTLGKSFNSMTSKLKNLIEEVYKNHLKRKEAELRALEAQINPHFLYNTLDVIYWTSRAEEAPKTGKVVAALAKLFKLGLNKGMDITTVEKEVEHLNSYLFIQKMRYDDPPKITVDIDKALYPYKTTKLVLQPLVENALCHGIDELGSEGIIKVIGRENGQDILFEVIDNGVGMNQETIEEVFNETSEEKRGYGLKNVNERIKLYFGQDYGLQVYSEERKGTKVIVRIPKYL
ncbi:MAG: putative signal transduction protein with a C-terminal ATPase domain [Clostridia bacterium]|nr:putative signal transduction protein with a C-terminal ATPase domain [Clostridia bacterium]